MYGNKFIRVLFILALAILMGFSASYCIAFTIPQSLMGATLTLTGGTNRQYHFTYAHYGYYSDNFGNQQAILYAYNVMGETIAKISYSYGYGWGYKGELTLTFTDSTSGAYMLVEAINFGGVAVNGTFQLLPPPDPPNLTPYKPNDWSDKIVVSKTTGTNTDSIPLLSTDTLYIDWAVINNGASDITTTFYSELYIDGVKKTSWNTTSLNSNYYTYITDYSIGNLSDGIHEIKIVTDTADAIAESDEQDNSYTKTITIDLKGDINGDGELDLKDAILGLQVLSGIDIPDVNRNADVNNDGKIGLAEVIYILQDISGIR